MLFPERCSVMGNKWHEGLHEIELCTGNFEAAGFQWMVNHGWVMLDYITSEETIIEDSL